jgi:hypothetical protein
MKDVLSGPNLLSALLYQMGAPGDPESFNVSPRRRLSQTPGATNVPANSSATITVTYPLADTLTDKDGLYFEWLAAILAASDTTGHLQVVDTAIYLTPASSGIPIVPLGVPTPTTLFPRQQLSLQFQQPPLLAARDLDQWSIQNGGPSLFLATSQPLSILLRVSLVNNDAAIHSAALSFWTAYRFVNGLGGA